MVNLLAVMGLFFGFGFFGPKKCKTAKCTTVTKTRTVNVETVAVVQSDQEACEEKARLMARLRSRSHHVSRILGRFEGIGVNRNPQPSTCTPDRRRGLRCTGDATVERDGWFYRVRCWR